MKEDQVVLVKLKADFAKAQKESHADTALGAFHEKIHALSKGLKEHQARLAQEAINSGRSQWYCTLDTDI